MRCFIVLLSLASLVLFTSLESVLPDEKTKKEPSSEIDHPTIATEQGNADLQTGSGGRYSDGRGGVRNYAEELKWAQNAAQQEDASAQFFLGLAHYNGRGVSQDYKEAARLFAKAANQGFNLAQFNLGVMYANGQGVPQDYVQAYMWFSLVHAGLKIAAPNRVSTAMESLANKMTTEEIAQAQRLAKEWKPKPAK